MEEEPEMNAQYIRGYEVTYAGFKVLSLHNLKRTQKTPQNFVQGYVSMKSLKLCHKNRGEFLVSGTL